MNNQEATIVTFYSYKGGVGRSMALANVAWVLAEKFQKKVLVVDWDLEAPGLHRFFKLADSDISIGLIELLNDYKKLLREELKSLPEKLVDIQKYVKVVERFRGGGTISILAAGKQDEKYATLINEFSWEEFYAKWHGFGFIEQLKKEFRVSPDADIILVDSRTGVTDIGGICTLQLPDIVVLLFALNEQNITGARSVAKKISKKATEIEGRERPPILILRAARVERTGNQKEKIKWQNIAASQLGNFLGSADPQRFMAKKNIPYIGDYSYGETPLATQKDPLGDMAESFEDLAGSILRATPGSENDGGPSISSNWLLPTLSDAVRSPVFKRSILTLTIIALFASATYYANYKGLRTAEQKYDALQQALGDNNRITELNLTNPVLELPDETYQRAIAAYDSVIEQNPQYAEVFDWRANAYSGLGNYDRAIQDYQRALALKPDYAEAMVDLGSVYKLMGDRGDPTGYSRAIESYGRAISIKPDFAEAYFRRGETYRTQAEKGNKEDYDRAIADYTKTIQLKRTGAEVFFKRGLAYKGKGDNNNALTDLQRALELPGDDVLRENVKSNLQELNASNPSPQLPTPPKIFILYNDPDDHEVLDQIAADLQSSGYKIVGKPQVSPGVTEGDVRCFNLVDFENEKAITGIVQNSLAKQGFSITIEARQPLAGYPNVPPGTIEVWIPSLPIKP